MHVFSQEGTNLIYRDNKYTIGLVKSGSKPSRCAVEVTVEVAGGKWKPLILHYLLGGTKRFGELRRLIGEVTQRSLTLQLRQLENHGVIRREVFAEVPPRVEYSLTERGRTLAPVLEAMKQWAKPTRLNSYRRCTALRPLTGNVVATVNGNRWAVSAGRGKVSIARKTSGLLVVGESPW